ncbi:MAG: response regulator transcription factor [Archangiaceae bacterium]|nr:response regulator transcription factor [Archangiaceae bacterium]
MISVLVVDDHEVVRRGLRQILSETEDIAVEGEAARAAEVMPLVRAREWGVVLLDLNIGPDSGLELLDALKRERPRLPVIVLTVYSEDQYAVRALKSGAAGFLSKETAPELLIEAVRKVVAGGRWVSPGLAERLASAIADPRTGLPHESLSNRELEVLTLIASGKTVGQIAQQLHRSVKTISTHRARLLAKMKMKTNAELTHYAIKLKLVT